MYRGKYEATKKGRAPARPVKQAASAQASAAPAPAKKPAKRRTTLGTKLFYFLYFVMVAALIGGIYYGLDFLNGWLVDYEASQPDTKCQQIFQQLFVSPDWGEIYDLLDPEATKVESKEAFVSYMEQRVGAQELTYSKTSAGLSGGRKYIIRLGDENLGIFTLSNSVTGELEIPDWQLNTVEIFVSSKEYVTVFTQRENTVYINGQPLDDSAIIRTTATLAEDYLPEDVHALRTATYYVDGLLIAPEVTVTDASGNPIAMDYDPDTRTYTEPLVTQTFTISQEEYDFVLEATKTYFKYMLEDATAYKLQSYFDKTSSTYKSIMRNEMWLQSYLSYDFSQETISGYCRYGDDLFSVRIAMDLDVTRTKGTIKTFSLDTTYFIKKTGDSWKIIEMTNVDVQKVLTEVRVTYMQDGQVLSSEMLSQDVTYLQTPSVQAPDGKVLAGWFQESFDENGDTTYTLVFQSDDNGRVQFPAGYVLEPLELHALFEKEGA